MTNEELLMDYLKSKKIELLEERFKATNLNARKIDGKLEAINDVMGFMRVAFNGEENMNDKHKSNRTTQDRA